MLGIVGVLIWLLGLGIGLTVFYFVVKAAVRNGWREAQTEMTALLRRLVDLESRRARGASSAGDEPATPELPSTSWKCPACQHRS